jgi:SAM-dependent methyltransferase
MPKCIFVNTYYGGFLASHYSTHSGLAEASYAEQLGSLHAANFGDSDFYSAGLRKQGWLAADIIVNCDPLQAAWARENRSSSTGLVVAVEQIRKYAPDVIYIQDMNAMPRALFEAVRDRVRLVVGQIATTVGDGIAIDCYDAVVSSMPHVVDQFRKAGKAAHYQPLAFAPRVLDAVGRKPWRERDIEVSFIGGISPVHTQGIDLLEQLARTTPIRLWGYGSEALPARSILRPRHQGEAWGNGMFAKLETSKITINRHADYADRFANNMRLFEATGCGALLITDYKDNLDDLFRIGSEVVAYRSAEECAALVQYYLHHPQEAEAIARAGRERTLRHHGYDQRMAATAELFTRHLRYRQEAAKWAQVPSDISSGHRAIGEGEIRDSHFQAWRSATIPAQQRALVQQELAAMYTGRAPRVYQALATALAPWLRAGERVIEIGCASGYYYEALEYLLKQRIAYHGVDYSEALIAMARDFYPPAKGEVDGGALFTVADGSALPFADGSFEVAVSGCVLLHVADWRGQIAEAARVASRAVVLHRTPIRRRGKSETMVKRAYGVETVEHVFAQDDVFAAARQSGLIAREAIAIEEDAVADRHCITYVFEKQRGAARDLAPMAQADRGYA